MSWTEDGSKDAEVKESKAEKQPDGKEDHSRHELQKSITMSKVKPADLECFNAEAPQ